MKNYFYKWVEQYLFFPNFLQQIVSILLFPLTIIYCFINIIKKALVKQKFFCGIPVVSIGNLIVGGSGKTPLTIAMAKDKEGIAVVLRGYGRQSTGLQVVSQNGDIKCDVSTSGDEAMLLASSLPKATIIVAENRKEGILKAKELGAKLVFLDDGFSKYDIEKFNILIRPEVEPTNLFCLPSGGYREPKVMYTTADMVLQDGKDFKRVVTFSKDISQDAICITAISKPDRLKKFLPQNVEIVSFPDHHNFIQEDLEPHKDKTIITTAKDMVKLEKFNLEDTILMDLEIQISDDVDFSSMDQYIDLANKANQK